MALEQAIIPVPVEGRLHPAKALDCQDLVDENKGNNISFNILKPRIIIEEKPDKRRKASLRFEFQVKIMSDHEQYSQHWRRLWHVKLQLLVEDAVDMEVKPRSDEAGRATITKENTRTNSVDLRVVGRFPTGAEAGVEVHMLKGGTLRVQQELQSWDCVQVFRKYRLRAKNCPQSHLRRLGTKFKLLRDKSKQRGNNYKYCQEWHWTSNTDYYYETPDHHVFSRVVEVSKYLSDVPIWEELHYNFIAEASIREGGHGISHLTRSKSRAPAERARKCRTIEKASERYPFEIRPVEQQGFISMSQLPEGTTLDIGRICDAIKVRKSNGGWETYPDGKFTAKDDQIQFDGNCVFDLGSPGEDKRERCEESVRLLITLPQGCGELELGELHKEAGKLREQIYAFKQHSLRETDQELDRLHSDAGELQEQLNVFRSHHPQERDYKGFGLGKLYEKAGKLREQIYTFRQKILRERNDKLFKPDGPCPEVEKLREQITSLRRHDVKGPDCKEFGLTELYKAAEKLRGQIYTLDQHSVQEKDSGFGDLYKEANQLQGQIYTFRQHSRHIGDRKRCGLCKLYEAAEELRKDIHTFNALQKKDHELDGLHKKAKQLKEKISTFNKTYLGTGS